MPHHFDLLPIELQASVVELRSSGVPEDAIDLLITRTLAALGVKTNQVQVDVWQIGVDLRAQLETIGGKLQADLQTQHGATNQMLIELRSAQMTAEPLLEEARQGVADIKKAWRQLNTWRGQVDTWRGSLDLRVETLSDEMIAIKQEIDNRGPLFTQILQEIAAIKHETLQDQLNRDERLKLTADVMTIPDLTARLRLMELMVERLTRLLVPNGATGDATQVGG